ncbi:Multidrug resistance protein Stp [Paenibacillus solanacearum]|uniref:Multidrug resistance protein Stp n=1 Tax=Paenibacillus solanacearum TaxID=2048548 RepID=A0A916K802_9BACL|nr:MFS transporter [Paenibacillus solanacearum]CAG7644433.1 Multidrug resistance protein Stp [Paenibacillus solanacearum]
MEKQLPLAAYSAAGRSRAFLLLGLSLGYFMVLLDTTVVGVALPSIRADLGGGMDGLQWVVNAYTIVFAGLLLSMGALSDKLGARRIYIAGLFVFLAASALTAAASSLGMLIAMRAALGVGGAALLPSSLALIAHAYPEPAARARALGVWAAVTGAAMAAGPVVGGALVDTLGWRSIFLLQVPLAVISWALTSRLAREPERKPQQRLDPIGQVTAFAAIASLSFALMEGDSYGWHSPVIISAFGIALLCAAIFLLAQARGRSPLLPLKMFRSATISAGMLAGMAINIGLSGILFVLPLYLQQVRAWPAHIAGLALLPLTVPLAFNPLVTGRIVARIGPKLPMTVGFALSALGVLLQAWTSPDSSYALTFAGLLLVGFGVSCAIPSLIAAVIAAVPKDQTGAASGALNSIRQLGATIGVALFGSMVGAGPTFMDGMQRSLILTAAILCVGAGLSFALIGARRR